MKKREPLNILLGLYLASILFGVLLIEACRKIDVPMMQKIDLGVKSVSTNIKSISQKENSVSVVFQTTPGAKYSIQVIPFGSDEPAFKDGFTATDTLTNKTYQLNTLPKKDYDFVFIDVAGKEVKYPITIK